MTDRLKFRIWDSLENGYRKFPEYNYIGGTFNLFSTDVKIVEQWTGLYDKNNKPIYEGDILGGVYGGYIAWCDNEKSFQMFSPLHECMSCSGDVLWQEIVEDESEEEAEEIAKEDVSRFEWSVDDIDDVNGVEVDNVEEIGEDD